MRGITVALDARLGRGRLNAAAVARRVRSSHAGALVFTGVTANGCPQIVRAVHRARPGIPLITGDGCLESGFTRRIGAGAARRTLVTSSVVAPADLGPAGADFASRFRARHRRTPGGEAAYGYEAMALALDAISRAGGATPDHRAAVVRALFATRDRDSILGRHSIDANGDTTLTTFGIYRVRARRPVWGFAINSAAG